MHQPAGATLPMHPPQVARGLRYMHMAQPMVMHRDLKLDNIMLTSEAGRKGGGGRNACAAGMWKQQGRVHAAG